MSDFPQQNQDANNLVITTGSVDSIGWSLQATISAGAGFATGTWPSANLAIYVPFVVRSTYLAAQMFISNGSAVSGNVDIGIYDSSGNRIVSKGSTAQATINVVQTFDITDTTLPPGVYYMALNMDNTTGQVLRENPAAQICRAYGVLQQAVGAVTLPATATFASATNAYIPLIGITSRTVV